MKIREHLLLILLITLVMVSISVSTRAETTENDAIDILKMMSDFVGSQKSIKLTFDSNIEIITPQLEKLQFTNSGGALVNRPNQLYAHRRNGHADVEMFFDGKTVNINDKVNNGYAQFDAQGDLDQLIHNLREGHGVALPGADFLLSNSFDFLVAGVMEAKYIGHGIIDGVTCEHLAFRNFDTDWQLWVEVGEKPIPRKLVVTSKTINSAPQYSLRIKTWESGADTSPSDFVFIPSSDAKKLDHNALIELDELPPATPEGGNP